MKSITSIPVLTGTEKQIAWAEDIRAKMIARFERLAAMPAENLGAATEAAKDSLLWVAFIGKSDDEVRAIRREIEDFRDDLPSPRRSDPNRSAIIAANLRAVYDLVLDKAASAIETIDSARAWIDYETSK